MATDLTAEQYHLSDRCFLVWKLLVMLEKNCFLSKSLFSADKLPGSLRILVYISARNYLTGFFFLFCHENVASDVMIIFQ